MLFLRIEDATCLLLRDGTRVLSPELLLAWQAEKVGERRLARIWYPNTMIAAHVNHGGWIINCPYCTMGVLTHPEWKMACCAECGAVYPHVTFPENHETIASLLLNRPRPNQNWLPHESEHDLRCENLMHGVVV